MYGLTRIFAIDSYVKGKIVPLELNGHACFNGFNAGGKTSTLKLIPFFYGAQPSDLVKKVAGKDSFIDRYLPRPTSILIFEYSREDGLCCVVVYRHPNAPKPVYRFLKNGYERKFFINDQDNDNFFLPKEFTTHWKTLNVDFSSLAIEDIVKYRAVIQNNKALFSRDRNMGKLARKFNLGTGKTSLIHAEKISLAILEQEGQLTKLREMIAEIMRSDNLNIPLIPSHQENKTIANQAKCLREFESKIPNILEIIKTSRKADDLKFRINDYAGTLELSLRQHNNEIIEIDRNINNTEGLLEDFTNKWLEIDLKFREEINEFKAEIGTLEKGIDAIQSQYDEYENNSLIEKKHFLEQLPQFEKERDEATQRYKILLENNEVELSEYEQKKDNIEKQYLTEKNRNLDKILLLANKENEITLNQSEAIENANNKLIKEKKDHELNNKEARDSLVQSMHRAESEANNVIRLDSEVLRLSNAEQLLRQCEQEIAKQKDVFEKCSSDYEIISNKHLSSLDELESINGKINQLTNDKFYLHGLLFPNDKSFLSVIKKEDNNWHKLTKILKKEVLNATHLNPYFDNKESSLYGWSIDTTILPSNDFCREDEELRKDYEQVEEKLIIANQHYKNQESLVASNKKELDESELNKNTEEAQLSNLNHKKDSLNKSYFGIEDEIKAAGLTRKKEAEKKAAGIKASLAQFDDNYNKIVTQLSDNSKKEKDEIREAFNTQLNELTEKKGLLDEDNRKQKKDLDIKFRQIEEDFNALMKENGVNDEQLESAKADKVSKENKCLEILNSKPLVENYKKFILEEWPNLAQKVSQLNDVNQKKTNKEAEHIKASNQYNHNQKELNRAKKEEETKKKQLLGLNIDIDAILRRANKAVPLEKDEETTQVNVKQTIADLDESLTLEVDLNLTVNKGIHRIEAFINQYSETEIAKSWYQSCEREASKLHVDIIDEKLNSQKPRLLDQLIKESLPQVKDSLIATIRNVCNEINDFAEGLSQADNYIDQQGSKIGRAVSSIESIKDISNVRFNMTSKIKDADYWPSLKHFQKERDIYVLEDLYKLPSSQLIDELEKTLLNLQSIHFDNDLKSLFELEIIVDEKDRTDVLIKSDSDLNAVSSKGLSYLLLCTIFIGMKDMLCKDKSVTMHWPMDELREIDSRNINLLFEMLEKGGISMVAGFADPNPEILKLFQFRHEIDLKSGIRMVDIPESLLDASLRKRKERLEHRENF